MEKSACIYAAEHRGLIGSARVRQLRAAGCEPSQTIAGMVGYRGRIKWDIVKLDGTPREFLDSSRLQALEWEPSVDLREGTKDTYEWHLSNAA